MNAETLAEQRRLAREQAQAWTKEVKNESDEEREKKAKRAARKATKAEAVDSAEEGAGEPKKRRLGGRRKKAADTGDEDSEALFSAPEDEGESKPVKKVCQSVVVSSLCLC